MNTNNIITVYIIGYQQVNNLSKTSLPRLNNNVESIFRGKFDHYDQNNCCIPTYGIHYHGLDPKQNHVKFSIS